MRRTHYDVKAGILKSCAHDSLTVSQLLASQNLSYKVLKPILDRLVSARLVECEVDGRKKLVRTTEQGVNAYRAYENALALFEGRAASQTIGRHVKPSSDMRSKSQNIVIEQKDRTNIQRPIMLKQ